MRFTFALDPFRKDCLANGLDEIGLTLENDAAIARYESSAPEFLSPGSLAISV